MQSFPQPLSVEEEKDTQFLNRIKPHVLKLK